MSIQTANLGFPRIGRQRELKFALEDFWSGKSDEATLQAKARALRAAHWQHQREAGISIIPSNDFSLYDHVLDLAVMTGAIPATTLLHKEDIISNETEVAYDLSDTICMCVER